MFANKCQRVITAALGRPMRSHENATVLFRMAAGGLKRRGMTSATALATKKNTTTWASKNKALAIAASLTVVTVAARSFPRSSNNKLDITKEQKLVETNQKARQQAFTQNSHRFDNFEDNDDEACECDNEDDDDDDDYEENDRYHLSDIQVDSAMEDERRRREMECGPMPK